MTGAWQTASVRTQTYIVVGVIIGCFSVLYPNVFHPMLMNAIGVSKPDALRENFSPPAHFGPQSGLRHRPPGQPVDEMARQPTKHKGGIMTMVLPIYAVGIVLYLLYTLSKVFGGKRKKNKEQKDHFLREYYRNFHYDVDRGEFRMGHDSSDEDETTERLNANSSNKTQGFRNPGQFDWAAAYGDPTFPNIYRSARSLPRDLERLLMKMDDESISTDELSKLRARLEHTENEMTKVLHAMRSAELAVAQSAVSGHTNISSLHAYPEAWSQVSTKGTNTSTDADGDDEDQLETATEGESDADFSQGPQNSSD